MEFFGEREEFVLPLVKGDHGPCTMQQRRRNRTAPAVPRAQRFDRHAQQRGEFALAESAGVPKLPQFVHVPSRCNALPESSSDLRPPWPVITMSFRHRIHAANARHVRIAPKSRRSQNARVVA